MSDHVSVILSGLGTAALVLLGISGLFLNILTSVRNELSGVRSELMSILKELSGKVEGHGERLRVIEDRSTRNAK